MTGTRPAQGQGPAAAVTPRPSSTVVLLRDSAAGPEMLLVERHARAAFGATHAFPGGVNERVDEAVGDRCPGVSPAALDARLGVDCGGLAYFSAAVRELFEETAILLATRGGEPARPADRESLRRDLNAGKLAWPAFLETEGLALACDALRYFSWWVTPRCYARRYSTRFFAARLPEGQRARHDGAELTDSRWMTARGALAAAEAGEIELPPPTRATLAQLGPFATTDEILGWAALREREGVDCILPAVIGEGKERRIVMPGDADYPDGHRGCRS